MNFLNSGDGYTLFEHEANKDTYVDKTLLIHEVYRYAGKINKYICITRPRRFGKSVAANMIAAFFDESTAEESGRLFANMEIGTLRENQEKEWKMTHDRSLCWPNQGKHKVIRINMIHLITEQTNSYQDFLTGLKRQMESDIREAYPALTDSWESVSEMLRKTGDRFVFVIDEWDAVFEASFMTEKDKEAYILFLKVLLKDQSYVQFAYMTGILPIAKYTSGSPLNIFHEFSAFEDAKFYSYFGLTEKEIAGLMHRKGFERPALEELSAWYDGYVREDGIHVYNPASVSKAIGEGACKNNWTGTGPMNEVRDIIQRNVHDLREDVIRMVSGEEIAIRLTGFAAEKTRISTKDEILSAMVVYGFLSYYNGKLRIPNHELMLKFQAALSSEQMGLRQTLEDSRKLLAATLERNHREVARLVEELHDEKIPFFQYNDENSLACVVTVGYLAALDRYKIIREDKAGKGYVDFLFCPISKSDPVIILELKYNRSAKKMR
ncbi:MAG: AAA family ATPase [Lachnospiraceae bacterium]|nr:AAA family ATPase [Lachnospiraceae bacterium]